MTLFSCGNTQKCDTIIIGTAQNAKAGAVLISKIDNRIYYIDSLDYWEDKILGKIVKVSGCIIIEKNDTQLNKDAPIQQIAGEKRIMQKPRWELLR